MVTPFAVLFYILSAVMIASTVLHFHKKKITASWAFFWSGLWVLGSVAIFFSGLLDSIGNYFIKDSGNIFVMYIAVMLLFFLVFRLFLVVQRLHESITMLVEELAKRKK